MARKIISLVIALFLFITSSGCWSIREMEDLGFAMGIGISKTDELYSVAIQFANPQAIVAEVPEQRDIYSLVERQGISIFDAFRNLSMTSIRRLYFPHVKVVIVDEEIAKEGIDEVLGFFKQDEEVRMGFFVLISKTHPKDILETPNTLGEIPAVGLSTLAEHMGANNKIYVADFRETINIASVPHMNYVTGLVEITNAPTEQERDFLSITSMAIFDHTRLVGYLDYEEGQAYNMITGEFFNGVIVFEGREDKKITIEGLGIESEITPKITNGKPSFDIKLTGEGNIAERIPRDDQDDLDIQGVKEQLDKVVEDKVNKAIKRAQQEYGVDYFNLSTHHHRNYPKEFSELKDDWNSHFSQAEVTVSADLAIIHPALGTYGGER